MREAPPLQIPVLFVSLLHFSSFKQFEGVFFNPPCKEPCCFCSLVKPEAPEPLDDLTGPGAFNAK